MKRDMFRMLGIVMAASLAMNTLSVWGSENNQGAEAANSLSLLEQLETESTVQTDDSNDKDNSGLELTDMQRNSIGMLNYLTVLTREINASKNSRLYLEDAYSALYNNTDPAVVDSRTFIEITDLLNTLEKYRMLSVKRERLEYIYEQNCAQAMKEAMPNPIGLLSAVESKNLAKMAVSLVYMAVDSYSSYTTYTAETDLEYLKDRWALDDEEDANIHESRLATLDYMVEMVHQYHLPSDLTLNEDAVDNFVDWKNNSNVVQRIQFLESNKETYHALGAYWLTLAESYFNNGNYQECINAFDQYEKLNVNIFRKDYELAKLLPLAVAASEEILTKDKYIAQIKHYVECMESNSDQNDWKLQYFCAQTYLDLYAKTGERQYMEKAYTITLNNVNNLVNEQKAMNKEYMTEIHEVEVPKDATKETEDEIKAYNKMLKQERKTELAPVSDVLLLNCELLFALANELEVPTSEKEKIDGILHENGDNIFLIEPLDTKYRFNPETQEISDILFDGEEIIIPAKYVSKGATIKIEVKSTEETAIFEDWELEEVDREDEEDFETFLVTYRSAGAKKHKYSKGDIVSIKINPSNGSNVDVINLQFKAISGKKLLVIPDIEFEKVKE